MPRAKKQNGHYEGYDCNEWYAAERRKKRTCSCGRPAIGVTKYGGPVCSFHNSFPTKAIGRLEPIEDCPGPHIKLPKEK